MLCFDANSEGSFDPPPDGRRMHLQYGRRLLERQKRRDLSRPLQLAELPRLSYGCQVWQLGTRWDYAYHLSLSMRCV